MSPRRLWALIQKEWREAFKNKMVVFGVAALPVFFLGVSVYLMTQFGAEAGEVGRAVLLNNALMYFLLMPMIIPLAIAVYSVVGEKEQGSLEPLLATPLTDTEIFVGKALAAVLPALAITWTAFGVYVAMSGFFVPWELIGAVLTAPWLLSIFLLSPLIAVFSVIATMAISSRTQDTRAAYQLSSFVLLPLIIPLIVWSVTQQALISVPFVLLELGIVTLLDLAALYVGVRLFRREDILTRWR